LYVDKTKEIYQLTNSNIIFLSRPRRFGKSLLISILEELYKGNKSLFEGLYIYEKWDWTQSYPVIRIDWTNIMHGTKEEMERSMSTFLRQEANFHEITLISEYAADCFSEMIGLLHRKTGKKVVVLIDEYDNPILDTMGKPEATDVRDWLQTFYKRLKANDGHLKFILLTGITKVAKMSIFSVLNNLRDITLSEEFATICGYTQQELGYCFDEYIEQFRQKLQITKAKLIDRINYWYDGYSWDGKSFVYNPFSTLLLFAEKEFSNYWFETGTPTFLIDRLKKQNLSKTVLEPIVAGISTFNSYDPGDIEDIPLLFQTGYLTVKEKKLVGEEPEYVLGVPNKEVKESLMERLLSAFTNYPASRMSPLAKEMLQQICESDAEGLQNNLRMMLADVPYTLHPADDGAEDANEARYHIIFQVWMTLLGFDIQSEKLTNRGRMDAVFLQPGLAVVAELKYHATTQLNTLLDQAITQIREKRYYEPFLDRKVILLGIAFSGKEVGCRIVSRE
jgi:hypothetical protein